MVKLSGRLVSALLVLCLNPAAFAAQEQTEPATANSELSQAASPTDDSLTTNDNAATQQADSQDAETETDRNVADATEAAYPESPETSNQDALEQPIPSLTEEESQQAEGMVNDIVERAREKQREELESRPKVPEDAIQINHVPEFIKNEIRDQVRADLRADVLQDVLTQAKNEQWGIPYALPGWVNSLKISGDLRVRGQADVFANDNFADTYVDIAKVNAAGGQTYAGPEQYINNTINRNRMRTRARLSISGKATENLKLGMRLSTGNTSDPVSTNQTLGNYGGRYQVVWDQVYLQYDGYDLDHNPWMTVWGGRMPNPWLSTDLVWDDDMVFEGVAGNFRINLHGTDSLLDMDQEDRTLYFTLGIFPIQEVELSLRDKWLYGAQIGTEFIADDQSSFNIALAYYAFDGITGVRNNVADSIYYDYTAPEYIQKGNIFFNIRNSSTDTNAQLWALAAKYKELNLTAKYDIAGFAPHHVVLTADVVKNVGYNQNDIEARSLGIVERSQSWDDNGVGPTKPRTLGYQFGVKIGWPYVTMPNNWNVSLFYKYLQRDAVLDAFTDSDFHLGGTDAKGWVLTASYGLLDNTWITARLLSTDSIDGEIMGVDTLQVDVSAKF